MAQDANFDFNTLYFRNLDRMSFLTSRIVLATVGIVYKGGYNLDTTPIDYKNL